MLEWYNPRLHLIASWGLYRTVPVEPRGSKVTIERRGGGGVVMDRIDRSLKSQSHFFILSVVFKDDDDLHPTRDSVPALTPGSYYCSSFDDCYNGQTRAFHTRGFTGRNRSKAH